MYTYPTTYYLQYNQSYAHIWMRLGLVCYGYSLFLWTWFRPSIRICLGCIANNKFAIEHRNKTIKHRSRLRFHDAFQTQKLDYSRADRNDMFDGCGFRCGPITPWAIYHIRKIVGYACAGNAGNVFPATDLLDTCRDRWPAVAGKTFQAFPVHAQPAILFIW